MSDYVQVSTATPARERAVGLAQGAVKAKSAASAQIIGPVVSVLRHLGEFGEGEERRLLLTTGERYPELERHLLDAHPWDNPELVATPISGAPRCLDRIKDDVRPEEPWAPACSSTFHAAGTFLCRCGAPPAGCQAVSVAQGRLTDFLGPASRRGLRGASRVNRS